MGDDTQAAGAAVEDGGGALATVADTVGDMITGIPAPIRKNAIRVFTRLCTAAVEYPVTLIENAIAEKRAESQARVKLINASADQIARDLQVNPEYARAAAAKFAQKIVRERVNLDKITGMAAEDLQTASPEGEDKLQESTPISEDWLNVFESEAAQMSSEQMQRLFGKILAGEIRRPSSYSIKTIKTIAQLDNRAASLFVLACSLSTSVRITAPGGHYILDARVIALEGNAAANSLQAYGLSFDSLNILQEYGLIISDYNSYRDYQMAVAWDNQPVSIPLNYQNSLWGLVPKTEPSTQKPVQLHGVALSLCGKELLPIVDIMPNEGYTSALKKFLDQSGFRLTPARVVENPHPASEAA